MDCEDKEIVISPIDLNNEKMALKDVFENVGAQVQVGRRNDTFWIALAILTTGVLLVKSVFNKKKRR